VNVEHEEVLLIPRWVDAGRVTFKYGPAVNPVVALKLLDSGQWSGAGVLGPEALPAEPFLELLGSHGAPWECEERSPA
jgi:saccharopine dehydrogenase-like NADP-dependent oxidoreductase